MAASYVLVTAAAVLVVEAVLLGVYVPSIVGDSDLQNRLQSQANRDANILSLAVSNLNVAAPGATMNELLNMAQKVARGQISLSGATVDPDKGVQITVTDGKALDQPIEALVYANGLVVTSSASGSYPLGSPLDVRLLKEGGGGRGKTRTGDTTWWSSPVLLYPPGSLPSGAKATMAPPYKIAGYVYVQAPSGFGGAGDAPDFLLRVLAPGALVLVLVVPVGLIFGLLSTRRLIGRVRHLANVTSTVAQGDFRPRVPVTEGDEVGQLEESFNRMTERLESALHAERTAGQAEARQAERGRIARELHDSISQDLFSLSLLAAGMRRAAHDRLQSEAESMERTATRAMREMQALLLELRPVALEDAGLVPAIEELCRAYETRLGLRVETRLEEVPLAPPAEHAVLRLVQEAFSNAIKHADPGLVRVRLALVAGTVRVQITDDGAGFDPSAVAVNHGMGLRLMRERVEELCGTFDLRTAPGHGTTVAASLPAASAEPPSRTGAPVLTSTGEQP
jgi:signal transduction histidine kinase